ncbi:MAG: SIS domain-containing protein [Rhodospirillales bacterium]|jgi:D-sedoheptulose 7-phosphate isomerase|nr:SIS domain-containing protein [Rhodospirillales bacterium]HIJ93509.1 SIS domain-containing protein [Rhodospirillaceae bacterium]HJP53631.1 SIS domain-containing protein [Rhodospirillales bacterium]
MDLDAFFDAELDEHKSVLAATREVLGEPFRRLVLTCAGAARNGGRIVFFGNGGSAADAQHLATELSVRYQRDRAPIAGFALTTNTSALTAIGNDFGFEDLFARQIQALCKPEDVVIGISTSGNSGNIIKALREAKNLGAVAAGFGGRGGGRMNGLADPFLLVPSDDTARIQEMHITLGHMLCGALEQELGLL